MRFLLSEAFLRNISASDGVYLVETWVSRCSLQSLCRSPVAKGLLKTIALSSLSGLSAPERTPSREIPPALADPISAQTSSTIMIFECT